MQSYYSDILVCSVHIAIHVLGEWGHRGAWQILAIPAIFSSWFCGAFRCALFQQYGWVSYTFLFERNLLAFVWFFALRSKDFDI
jgi:hypothetical protein